MAGVTLASLEWYQHSDPWPSGLFSIDFDTILCKSGTLDSP